MLCLPFLLIFSGSQWRIFKSTVSSLHIASLDLMSSSLILCFLKMLYKRSFCVWSDNLLRIGLLRKSYLGQQNHKVPPEFVDQYLDPPYHSCQWNYLIWWIELVFASFKNSIMYLLQLIHLFPCTFSLRHPWIHFWHWMKDLCDFCWNRSSHPLQTIPFKNVFILGIVDKYSHIGILYTRGSIYPKQYLIAIPEVWCTTLGIT